MAARSVWILNHYAQGPDLPGGTRHYEIARRLVQRGLDVSLIASQFHHATRAQTGTGRRPFTVETLDGVKLVRVRSATSYRGNGIARMLNMSEFALRVRWLGRSCFHGEFARPDVIVGSSPHLLAALAAERLARRFQARFVFEVRDLWPESLVALGAFGRRHPIVIALRSLECRLYRRADAIVSLLPEAWRYIAPRGRVPREKISWIPNGASLGRPAAEAASAGEPRPLTVMYLGAHGRANVLDDLITAARMAEERRLPVRFVLVGNGSEKARLEARARNEGLENVRFEPPVPKSAVQGILAGAAVLVALLEDT
ncbi:MAG: glycosyltransferase family 4 protein, partial [bacterium]